ncbi:MAG: hypothetical protein K2N06_02685 [Oscillospiraceae bacterium]|nr:hypothetical protein [Oscillospiraceae bacterium]
MQLKYSFNKEWIHFWRTGRFWGILGGIIAFAFTYPLMFKFMDFAMEQMQQPSAIVQTATAAIQDGTGTAADENIFGDMAGMYSDGGMMFATSIIGLSTYSLLIVMLVLMSAAGGEQKKRAMIIPMCAGLKYENYLLPKFVIYPLVVLVETFLCSLLSGALCSAMFEINPPTAGNIVLSSALMAVYMAFITAVYLSVGLCTSRPGVMTPVVFLGQTILQSILEGFRLTDYHPFALTTMISRINSGEFDLAENLASIMVSVALAVVISVMMYFLALGVLKAKRVDNQSEEKPEF